ncbi:MAG: adenylosuccinate lyase [Candidatus Poribacteria bacterium]
MIERYSRKPMTQLWSDRYKYLTWLRVEFEICDELAANGHISKKDFAELKRKITLIIKKGGISPEKIAKHEALTRHDVIAFTSALADELGSLSRYIHFGLTSSDVVDTSLSIIIQQVGSLLLKEVEALLAILWKLAIRYRDLPTIGRSHGMFAEPTSFGLKFLGWHCEWTRNKRRLENVIKQMCYGKLAGAVGVNSHWDPDTEMRILSRLGLEREPVSTQVIPRDRHADFMNVIGICGSSLERMALELRHLQRSEVGEVSEGFQKGQKGSSAMPHKRNPVSSENITGCARLLRAYAQAQLENISLWHERDISHSSVERVVFPDATILLDYGLNRMGMILSGLTVDESRVLKNLNAAGSTVFSGHYMLELVRAGVSREDAYSWIQECALASLDGKGDFIRLLSKHPKVSGKLTPIKIRDLASIKHQLRNVGRIYELAKKHG